MTTQAPVETARIELTAGCIRCQWCSNLLPQVFAPGAESARIRSDAVDGDGVIHPGILVEDELRFLDFVADGCPPQVIKVGRD